MSKKETVSESKDGKNGFFSIGLFFFSFVVMSPLLVALVVSLLNERHGDLDATQYAKNIDSFIADYENCIPDKDVGLFLFEGVSCKNKKDALEDAAREILFLNKPSTFPDKKKYPESYAKVQETIKNAIFKFVKYKHYDLAFSALYNSRDNINPTDVLDAIKEVSKRENVLNGKHRYASLIDYTPYWVTYYLSEIGFYQEEYLLASSLINDFSDEPWVSTDLASSITKTLLSFGCRDEFISWSNYLIRLHPVDWYGKEDFSKYYLDTIKYIDSEKLENINKNTSWLIKNKEVPSLSASCELKPYEKLAKNAN